MTQQEFFERVLATLDRRGVEYMVTGSIGAMLYGEPRLTNDLDVVLRIAEKDIPDLVAALAAPDCYVPPAEAVAAAARSRKSFNIVHAALGAKVDFQVVREGEFAEAEFARRRRVPFSTTRDCVSATPEDIILMKLVFYRDGRSEKHLRDIRGILAVSGEALDMAYMERWVRALALAAEWTVARRPGPPA